MARSIVLRFDAVCTDCGRSLSAGSSARWFGRGRVSCCGSANPDDVARRRPSQITARDVFPDAPLVPPGSPVSPQHAPIPPYLD